MADWNGFLDDDDLKALRDILIEAGFDTPVKLDYLRGGLPAKYRAGLEGQLMAPLQQLLVQLRQMNLAYSLRSGERPLEIFLTEALDAVSNAGDAEKIEHFLGRVRDDLQSMPTFGLPGGFESAGAGQPAVTDLTASANHDITEEASTNGLDETVAVDFLQRGAEAARSVFKIVVKRFFDGEQDFISSSRPRLEKGTGWVIAPGLAITNHHVIDARALGRGEELSSQSDLELQAARAEVLFDYVTDEEDAPGVELGDGTLIAFSPRGELDYAILRLPAAAAQRPPLRLVRRKLSKRLQQALGTRVNVLQHPNGKPMRLGFRTNYVILGDDDILAYLTDTAAGSSGSPVLDDDWRVAALHRGARGISKQDIKILNTLVKQENIGTQVTRILSDLEARFPALHREIVDGQQAVMV